MSSNSTKKPCSTGPLGSVIANAIPTGVHGPDASIAATNPGVSGSMRGVAARVLNDRIAFEVGASEEMRLGRDGANLLHSIEKPRSATRGEDRLGILVIRVRFPSIAILGYSPAGRHEPQKGREDMPKVDGQRVVADLKRLAEFGRYKTGVHRPTYSPVDIESRHWLAEKLREAGLDPVIDGIGNVIGRNRRGRTAAVGRLAQRDAALWRLARRLRSG